MVDQYLLSIDQGTTSSRAILFAPDGDIADMRQKELSLTYPHKGWVEQNPEDIWEDTLWAVRTVVENLGGDVAKIAAAGITNQRETTIVWDRHTGEAVYNAIVWQDRRTAELCAQLKEQGHEDSVTEKTGLLLDPYFSATKIAWILDNVEGARERAEAGDLLFGTVDSYLVWKFTHGARHVTDITNASRTMLYNIVTQEWDDDLLALFNIPRAMLPEVQDNVSDFGVISHDLLPDLLEVSIPIGGIAGDQQAALIGQGCFEHGMVKSTYGTGCFALLNTGGTPVTSGTRMLTTIAYQVEGRRTYALEGSIFIAGAVVQWLRDGLGIIESAGQTGALAASADPGQDLVIVPAFTGLGAPYWQPECRGAMFGLTRNSGPAEFARAALESVAFQTRDLVDAMRADWSTEADTVLRVDGGMSASDWTMQALSDILGAPVDRPMMQETTALGAAWLAGMQAGVYPDQDGFAATWALERQFTPTMDEATRTARHARWKRAVAATMAF